MSKARMKAEQCIPECVQIHLEHWEKIKDLEKHISLLYKRNRYITYAIVAQAISIISLGVQHWL